MIELAAAITLSGLARCELRSQDSVVVSDRYIRIRDVVALPCSGNVRSDIGDEIIAALPDDASRVGVSRAGVRDLVNRRLPGLIAGTDRNGGEVVTFSHAAPKFEEAPPVSCFSASHDLAAGDIVDAADVAPAPCAGRAAPSLSYDRKRSVLRASQAIEAGDYLGRLMPLGSSKWDENNAVKLRLRIGPVTIQRDVWVLEPDAGAPDVFVRDADGVIMSAPAAALQPAEPGK